MDDKPEPDLPTVKPDKRPSLEAASIILVSTSMTNNKRRGERGSPWRSPLKGTKKSVGDPLTRTAKEEEEIQKRIQSIHLSPKPILSKTEVKKSQFT